MKKRICAILALLILFSIMPIAGSAETIVDLDKKGSITVKAIYNKVPLQGMKLNCIQVGKLVPSSGQYYYECIYNDDIVYTAANVQDADNPEKMLKLVKSGTKVGVSKTVNKNGYLKFEDLYPGLYLIYQKDAFSSGGNKYEISPFLVTIPYDGEYHVDAESKPGLDLYPEKPKPSTGGTGGGGNYKKVTKLPQTGQLSWPIPVMACCGMALFVLGWWLCFSGRKDSNEK